MIGLGSARAWLLPSLPPVGAPCGGATDDPCAPLRLADPLQDAGLGRQLLQRLARHAHRQGVRHLHGDVLWDNAPMLGLVERLGGRLQAIDDEPGVLRAWLDTSVLSA